MKRRNLYGAENSVDIRRIFCGEYVFLFGKLSEIKKALLLIRGVASVRVAHGDNMVTPALRSKIRKARKESSDGKTILCSTPEEMQQYFDSL